LIESFVDSLVDFCHFYHASYASAVLGVVILSVRHTRAL